MARDTVEMFEADVPVKTKPIERTTPYTNQEVFDIVVKHLRDMPKQSLSCSGACLYRNPSGLRCAIGALIPDSMYNQEMEGTSAPSVILEFFAKKSKSHLFCAVSMELLRSLQEVHDTPGNWQHNKASMPRQLSYIASSFGLNTDLWSQQWKS